MRGIPGSDDDLMVQTFHPNSSFKPEAARLDASRLLRAQLSHAVPAEP